MKSGQHPTLPTGTSRTQREMGIRKRFRPRREWAEFTVAAVLLALATFTAAGTATMDVVGDDHPGPRFFPSIIAALLYATAVGIVVRVVRQLRAAAAADADLAEAPQAADATPAKTPDTTPRTDWRTLGIVVAALVGFMLVLEPLGWLLSATGLYWVLCTALGAKKPGATLAIALVFSALAQIAFSIGLGLPLPAGILGGIF
ncbi:tripartite tricarboxylate transporter TctB family protein [Saccharomonospora sp. NPDC046836]|uniref:tripartite tricarboxylate transporter TctB family protein n=1 Tax=Saccharomonospora sp. NPDC046836 TaxID=3156921 RepID=UPI0033EF287B